MKKYPFVKQNDAKDCGVCTLQMIIEYYKGYIDKITLEHLTKTSKNGTTAYNIINTARKLNFESDGYNCDLLDLKAIKTPFIAHVIINGTYQHYVVIYNIDFEKQILLIADPATKIKKMSFEEFNLIWTKVIITFTLKKPIIKQEKQTLKKYCYKKIKNYKKQILSISILSIFIIILSIVCSFYSNIIFNLLNLNSPTNKILNIFIIFTIITFVNQIFIYIKNKIYINFSDKLDRQITTDIIQKVIFLPYKYYSNHTTGEMLNKINEINKIKNMILSFITFISLDSILIVFSLTTLFIINKLLFCLIILILIVYFCSLILFNKIKNKYIENVYTLKNDATSYIVESIKNYETLKGINIEKSIFKQTIYKYNLLLKELFNFEKVNNFQDLIKSLIEKMSFLAILFIGTILIVNNQLTIGTLITFYFIFSYLIMPLNNLNNLVVDIMEAKISFENIVSLFNKSKKNNNLKFINGNINFNNLSFSYNDYNNSLTNINLEIKKGKKVLIIGSSGSGKSTLVKLLKKYFEVSDNQILINKIDLNSYNDESLNEQITYISQKEELYTDTIYNNIILNRNYNKNRLLKISNLCNLDEFVNKLELGYNFYIEENGFNLSGGEIQRIVLARSIMKKFEILIIDEGLNQMDVNLERRILKNIFKEYKSKTIIIVSHRYENKDLYDQIIRLENGIIVEDVSKLE